MDALCPPDALYDAIIGNIPGARAAEDPDPRWTKANVVTRAQAKQRDVSCPAGGVDTRTVEVHRSQ